MEQMPDEVLGQLIEDCRRPQDILGANVLLASLQKPVPERILEAEPNPQSLVPDGDLAQH